MNQEVRFAKRAPALDRILTLELVRVTERAAVAAARLRGRGDEMAADQAAVDAMRRELNRLPIDGTVVIGEGERDEAPMLYHRRGGRHAAGARRSTSPSIRSRARRSAAKNLPNAHRGRSPSPRRGACSTRPTSTWTRSPSARATRRASSISTRRPPTTSARSPRPRACRSARSRPASSTGRAMRRLIEELRATGAAIRLIGDGDVAGVIHATEPGRDRHRHLSRHRRRARGRARRGGAPLHRRPDAGPAGDQFRRAARARAPHGRHRPQPQIRHERDGARRRAVRGDRRHRRQPALRRPLRPARRSPPTRW